MKYLIITIALCGVICKANAQNRGITEIDSSAQYCLIMATKTLLSQKVTIDIDFGQERFWYKNTTRLVDPQGNGVKFNSPIDAINYMSKEGWEYVDAYAITVGNANVYHYLMRKRN